MTDTKLGPEQIAELKAARAVSVNDTGHRTTCVCGQCGNQRAASEKYHGMLRQYAPALIAAAERCGAAEAALKRLFGDHNGATIADVTASRDALAAKLAGAEAKLEAVMARVEEAVGAKVDDCPLTHEAALAALDAATERRHEVDGAIALRLTRGCSDTCSRSLVVGCECDCGHEALKAALVAAKGGA